ncbi:hypothetical protein D046_5933B, partial [Vibrio parahaemolyticus V-223/04]
TGDIGAGIADQEAH